MAEIIRSLVDENGQYKMEKHLKPEVFFCHMKNFLFKLHVSGRVESPPGVPMFSFAERVHLPDISVFGILV